MSCYGLVQIFHFGKIGGEEMSKGFMHYTHIRFGLLLYLKISNIEYLN